MTWVEFLVWDYSYFLFQILRTSNVDQNNIDSFSLFFYYIWQADDEISEPVQVIDRAVASMGPIVTELPPHFYPRMPHMIPAEGLATLGRGRSRWVSIQHYSFLIFMLILNIFPKSWSICFTRNSNRLIYWTKYGYKYSKQWKI